MPAQASTFGENLRRQREAAGLTQEALGRLSGLHPTEISRLEGAVRDPRLATIVRLARAPRGAVQSTPRRNRVNLRRAP